MVNLDRYQIPIFCVLWLGFIALLYASFGQIIRIEESVNGYSHEIIHLPVMLLILTIDVIFKALMFHLNIYHLSSNFDYLGLKGGTIIITSIGTYVLSYFITQLIFNVHLQDWEGMELSLDYFFPFGFIFHVIIFFLAFGYHHYKNKVKFEAVKTELKQIKLETELDFLKSQISPHFLFNTLNNIYGLVRKSSNPEVAQSIFQFSRLFRYTTYQSSANFVSLENEIDYLSDLVELQRLRLHDSDGIVMKSEISDKNPLTIAPMILSPFIENAFKHGIATSQFPIQINISTNDWILKFGVTNRINKNRVLDSEYSGIGLENVKRRLTLIYPNRHNLTLKADNHQFEISLEMNLKHG